MKKYVIKQETVEAQQWFPGVDIPILQNVKCCYITSTSHVGYIYSNLFIYAGYWVVKYKDGQIEAIPNEDFVKRFEEVYP